LPASPDLFAFWGKPEVGNVWSLRRVRLRNRLAERSGTSAEVEAAREAFRGGGCCRGCWGGLNQIYTRTAPGPGQRVAGVFIGGGGRHAGLRLVGLGGETGELGSG
jgi:hypothetical protein